MQRSSAERCIFLNLFSLLQLIYCLTVCDRHIDTHIFQRIICHAQEVIFKYNDIGELSLLQRADLLLLPK